MASLTSSLPTSTATAAIRARNQRVEHYRSLVRPIAVHYHQRCSEPLDDLIQVGLMGLLRAAELYRPAAATPFAAFARPHIRGAMLHYLRDVALPIRLPRRLDEQRQQLARLRALWLARHHRPATDSELRRALGLEAPAWARLLAAEQLVRLDSLDAGVEFTADSVVSDQDTNRGLDQGFGQSSPACLEGPSPSTLLLRLEEPLRLVVERVILGGWSYRRTATALKVSPMTVQRRLRKGLALLRDGLLSREPLPHPVASAAPGC